MALKLVCDGCDADLPQAQAVGRGVVERVFYCHGCAAHVDAMDAALDAERARLAVAFEAFRAERLTHVRKALKKLPDE